VFLKKIAYIELDTHAEIASLFMSVMKESRSFETDYYFSERIFHLLGKHQHNIHITEPGSVADQLKGKNYDLVIIGTVHRYFSIFENICEKYPTAVFVHNVNFSQASVFQLIKSVFQKDVIYRTKLLVKEDLLSAPEVYRKARARFVLDRNMAQQGRKYFPLYFSEFYKQTSVPAEPLNVVIPGSVSQRRRDYLHVLELLKSFSAKIKVVFLGKASGKELRWLQRAQKELPDNICIEYFREKVSAEIFREKMQAADVLWCPLQKETTFFGIREVYGDTKMSGNIGDAIRYGKIAVFPENDKSDFPFVIPENPDHVQEQLIKHASLSYDFEKEFSQMQVLKQLEEVLNEVAG